MDVRLKRQLIYGLLLLLILGLLQKGNAQPALNVAVAANFAPAMEQISRSFTSETSIPVQLTISSSGRLFAQIRNRAPFDLFFSADSDRPEKLHDDGICGEPVRYATGRVVLWSRDRHLCDIGSWQEVVRRSDVTKIAMANPATAPYGTVAREALAQLVDWPALEKKVVYGANVGQAFQYVQSGSAQAAFVAVSLASSDMGTQGCSWEVKEATPVAQMACVTSYSPNSAAAEHFLQYAASMKTSSIREALGYR